MLLLRVMTNSHELFIAVIVDDFEFGFVLSFFFKLLMLVFVTYFLFSHLLVCLLCYFATEE